MSFRILLYRKVGASPTKRPTKALVAALTHALLLARVQRPALVQFFTSGQFHKLPALSPQIVKNPALRRRDHMGDAYVIEVSDLGRAKGGPDVVAMSVRIWIERYIVAAGIIGRDEFAIVVETD
jgi:hypothetical protein